MRKFYGSRCYRTYIKSTKIPGFHTFFEILGISLEIQHTGKQGPRALEDPGPLRTLEDPGP